jgi:protein TonB
MKRNEKNVPGFDEIIFANRNQEYGAYDLRKRYKSVTSLAILGAAITGTLVVILLAAKPQDITASSGPGIDIIVVIDDYIPPPVDQPVPKMPPQLQATVQNIPPEVVNDTSVTSDIPITDDIIRNTTNGDVTDTLVGTPDVPVDIIPPEQTVFIKVEEDPEFPGGERALLEFIGKSTQYPTEAIDNNIEGRVILKFVVNSNGSVDRTQILKGVDPLLDKEAIRVISTLPRFKPGKQNGIPVAVWYTVPVLFRITR